MTNKGSAYNTANGVFTAPRAGNYIFIWNSMTKSDQYCYLYLYKNGNPVNLAAYSDAHSTNTDGGSMSVVLELTTGDRVWVESGTCGWLYGGDFISFTGCQLWRKSLWQITASNLKHVNSAGRIYYTHVILISYRIIYLVFFSIVTVYI